MEEFMRKQPGCIICMGNLLGLCSSQPQYCWLDSLHEYCQAVANHDFIFLLSLVHLSQTCGFKKDKSYELWQTVAFLLFLQIFFLFFRDFPRPQLYKYHKQICRCFYFSLIRKMILNTPQALGVGYFTHRSPERVKPLSRGDRLVEDIKGVDELTPGTIRWVFIF